MVEHPAVNRAVEGSSPSLPASLGRVAEWLKAPDCKSGITKHGGSNPPSSTNLMRVRVLGTLVSHKH